MRIYLAVFLIVMGAGCRAKPAPDDYRSQEEFKFDAGAAQPAIAEFEAGPAPYRVGDSRLSLGIFYEGGFSDELRLNPPKRDLQVFVVDPQDPDGTLTVDIQGTDDRSEGRRADQFTFRYEWFGCQVIYQDGAEDLSAWKTLFVSLKSSGGQAENIDITMNGQALPAALYGYVNDGNWHHLAIPTRDFETDLTRVDRPFGINGKNLVVGQSLVVDDLYFSQSIQSTQREGAPPSGGLNTNMAGAMASMMAGQSNGGSAGLPAGSDESGNLGGSQLPMGGLRANEAEATSGGQATAHGDAGGEHTQSAGAEASSSTP